MKNEKDLFLCSFYMPHRNLNDLNNLDMSQKNSMITRKVITTARILIGKICQLNITLVIAMSNRNSSTCLSNIISRREDNILDLVFTNNPSLTKSSISIPGISDHAMVVTASDIKPIFNIEKPRKVYLYSKANRDNMSLECSKLSDDLVDMSEPNVEMMWERLKTGIQSIMDTNIPSKMFRKQNTEFKKAEINYINKTIHEGLENNNTPLKQKGVLVNKGTGKAQILLEQFSSVFTRNAHRSLPVLAKQYKYDLPSLYITTPGVEKLLSKLNTSKAMGPDKISNVILKNCASQLAPGICLIFKLSTNSGVLPCDWVNANISPVYKKGDVHLDENYRPVSLTSILCKPLEQIICKHLLNHLERNKILTNLNNGFRSGYSCKTQLL
ncbi:RTJK-like protein, partial [Mya arenaria]